MKMWAGRFQKESDERLNDFNSSIGFDCRMFREDIEGSLAHAQMLCECNIIEKAEHEQIVSGLNDILHELESGALEFDKNAEDIHMFIEAQLTQRVGAAGKRLHTARSRNDQVALDLRLYLRKEIKLMAKHLTELIEVLCTKAEQNVETIMPGYTHLQRAQPITFGHHLMAYAQMLLRDKDRLKDCMKRMNELPLGCGALATTTYNINRERAAELLNFKDVMQNSLDGVADRDYCVELCSALALIMVHLSRFCEEIIMWSSWEFKFIELDDAFATGSSIMPQKKNPDIAELVRGKTGRVTGSLITLLTALKGLPLAYNKDMQEDKEAVFDAVDTVKMCLTAFTPMLQTARVLEQNMKKAASGGFINATDCADYLVKKGMPFRDAYKITGELVAKCIENKTTLEELSLECYKEKSPLFDDSVYRAIDMLTCVNERSVTGGPAKSAVLKTIKATREKNEK